MKKLIQHTERLLFFILAMTLLLLFTDDVQAQASVSRQTITGKKFTRKMQDPQAVVLDVRTAEEFNAGHLPNALHLDVKQENFSQQVDSLDKNKTYLIYCKSGRRSEKALRIMNEKGFQKAFHLKGGYAGWKGKIVQ